MRGCRVKLFRCLFFVVLLIFYFSGQLVVGSPVLRRSGYGTHERGARFASFRFSLIVLEILDGRQKIRLETRRFV